MPNWCSNTLTVTGEPEKVAEFVEQMKGIEYDEEGTPKGEIALDFEAVMPMPRVLKGRRDGEITWYTWQFENWGIKWGACDSYIDSQKDGEVVYLYDTAWGPGIDWLETLMRYFPWLDFHAEWHELNMGFAGELSSKDGKLGPVKDWEVVWDDESQEVIPAERAN